MSILDRHPRSHKDSLWLVSKEDGSREVKTQAEEDRRGIGFPRKYTYREAINRCLREVENDMKFWLEFQSNYIAKERHERWGTAIYFAANGKAYTAYIGTHHTGHMLGFGGEKFTVTMEDGHVFESNNVWHRGDIPESLRDLLCDNAVISSAMT